MNHVALKDGVVLNHPLHMVHFSWRKAPSAVLVWQRDVLLDTILFSSHIEGNSRSGVEEIAAVCMYHTSPTASVKAVVEDWEQAYDNIALFPGHMGGEELSGIPGIHCLHMRLFHLEIHVHLKIGKTIWHTSISSKDGHLVVLFPFEITFKPQEMEAICCVHKAKMLSCGYQLVLVSQYATRSYHLSAWPQTKRVEFRVG